MEFTPEQLRILEKGLKKMFNSLNINVTTRMVNTSEKSVSLYIKFNDRDARTVRISSHKPVRSQEHYVNIFVPSSKEWDKLKEIENDID